MMPEEWPIAAPMGEAAAPARAAGRGRLRTVRADFFLNPTERLTEQERALMTAMLHCLVADVATELRAALPAGWVGANDDEADLVDRLTRAGLLDVGELIGLLLQRAEEERIGSAARARSGRREARALQALVSHDAAEVSAAAMALILARGRRRNRFGQCLLSFDDLGAATAEQLANAISAGLRSELGPFRGGHDVDAELVSAAASLMRRQDQAKSIEALTEALTRALAQAGALTDDLFLACAQEGEVGFLAHAAAVLGNVPARVAVEEFLSGDARRLVRLMRVADFSRDVSAGILASIGDLLGVDDAGAAISLFDSLGPEQVAAAKSWLAASPAYRAALDALGGAHG